MSDPPRPLDDDCKILLVEDDAAHADLVGRWLTTDTGATVTTARDGQAGQALALEHSWDLVISDIEMPGLDGLELSRRIKVASPRTPVMLMTAHERIDYAIAAVRCQVDEFALKPLDPETVAERARRLIALARQERRRARRILAIGAHPDDVEIGCGGLLLRHARQGDAVLVLTLTNGEEGGAAARRSREAIAAAVRMGAEVAFGGLPDTRLSEATQTIDVIERAVRRHGPDTVYVHSDRDQHQDHRAAYRATMVAARGVPAIYCYQSPSSTVDFRPTAFADITNEIEDKVALLATYESQFSVRSYLSPEIVRATARYWGRFASHGYAEPLETLRAAVQG